MNNYDTLRMALYTMEALSAVTGLLYIGKLKGTYWAIFPIYLLTIAVFEIFSEVVYALTKDNGVTANLYFFFGIPIQFLFFIWLFYRYFTNRKNKLVCLFSFAIYTAAWIVDLAYFRNKQFWFSSLSYGIGNIMLLVLLVVFFITFVRSPDLIRYRKVMMFWVALGLLLFYLGTLPYYGIFNTLAARAKDVFRIYWIIQMVLNCLMYFIFFLSFIWSKPK
jgi:hypothetical protein